MVNVVNFEKHSTCHNLNPTGTHSVCFAERKLRLDLSYFDQESNWNFYCLRLDCQKGSCSGVKR